MVHSTTDRRTSHRSTTSYPLRLITFNFPLRCSDITAFFQVLTERFRAFICEAGSRISFSCGQTYFDSPCRVLLSNPLLICLHPNTCSPRYLPALSISSPLHSSTSVSLPMFSLTYRWQCHWLTSDHTILLKHPVLRNTRYEGCFNSSLWLPRFLVFLHLHTTKRVVFAIDVSTHCLHETNTGHAREP